MDNTRAKLPNDKKVTNERKKACALDLLMVPLNLFMGSSSSSSSSSGSYEKGIGSTSQSM